MQDILNTDLWEVEMNSIRTALFILLFFSVLLAGQPGEWTNLGDGSTAPVLEVQSVEAPFRPAPRPRPSHVFEKVLTPMEAADTTDIRVAIRPGQALTVEIDPSVGRFFINYPDDGLSPICSLAVSASPEWIRERLALQLPHFGAKADSMAQEIIDAPPDIVDEVAFVVATLAPEAVLDDRFDAELVTENAEWIYRLADSLAYVELVEDATPGNERTTARYRCVDLSSVPPDTVWMEIPHEAYYWWVVHPVLTDEAVKKRDDGTETQQCTYGYFWREYLWTDPHPGFPYTAGGYPLLADYMKPCRFLWLRRDTMFTGMRTRTDDDGALNALGNWTFRVVPNPPVSPRGIQPNQIAFNHGGNCGEI
ncbi:hypothetical protein DRQ36_10880 [bacterium]|nr:MAG: hypothetical protein DRQ36_10880 [bacterium]